jgi:molecular chaperone GrpE
MSPEELDETVKMTAETPEDQDVSDEGSLLEVKSSNEEPADPPPALQAELESAKARAQEATDQYIRLLAEFDNFRKRSRKEYDSLLEYASEKVLSALLPVLDDFDRTLTAMEKTDNLSSIKEGITLVTNKLHKTLEKEGLNLIECAGQPFDSSLHEAIHSIEVSEEKKGIVLEQAEKGYRLKDKVIRYAKVIVGE